MQKLLYTVMLVSAVILASCGEEKTPTDPGPTPITAAQIYGLFNGRTLTYQKIDSTITFVPEVIISVDTSTVSYSISSGGGEFVVKDGATPVLNIRYAAPLLLLNGYWRTVSDSSQRVYFPTPAVLLKNDFASATSWETDVPKLGTEFSTVAKIVYYGYFGFHQEKRYLGQATVLVPAGSFKTYHFSSDLYLNASDSLPAATVDEWLAVDVGLVKQVLRGKELSRVMSLTDY